MRTKSVILDIDLDYFSFFQKPKNELKHILSWAFCPVDTIVKYHHESYTRWNQMITAGIIGPPKLIIHVDEHHDMFSDKLPVNSSNFIYFAMKKWSNCRVIWVIPQPIDNPRMWLSDRSWSSVSSRFKCSPMFNSEWPKPDLITVSKSPDFIDNNLSQYLLQIIKNI